MAGHAEELRTVPLFAEVSERQLQRIASKVRERRFDPGTSIVTAGETGVEFYLILDGRAEVHRDGRVVRALGQGDYFGEMALLRDRPRSATVIARDPLTCMVLTREDLKIILNANPDIMMRLLETVASRWHDDLPVELKAPEGPIPH